MSEPFIPIETASSLPIADVKLTDDSQSTVVSSYSYTVKQPEEDVNDFIIEVKASNIKKIRSKIMLISSYNSFPWHELLLGLSTTSLGAFIGGLISNVKLDSKLGIFVYIICLAIFIGTGVGYFFKRHLDIIEPRRIAKELLDELVDPDKTTIKEKKL